MATLVNDPKSQMSEQIARVRQLAQIQLARFARLPEDQCKEVYLFENDRFSGIRFTLGVFRAKWMLKETQISFSRDGKQILVTDIEGESQRAAA